MEVHISLKENSYLDKWMGRNPLIKLLLVTFVIQSNG